MITLNSAGDALSSDFLQAIAEPVVSFDLMLLDEGEEIEGDVRSLTLALGGTEGAQDASVGIPVGAVYSTQLDCRLYGQPTRLLNHELEVRIGVDVGESFEYVTVAFVTVTSSRTAGGMTAIRAVGRVSACFSRPAIGLPEGRYLPRDVASALTSVTGVAVTLAPYVDTGATMWVGADWTCHEALAGIASAIGGFACDTHDGGVMVSPFGGAPTYTLSEDVVPALPQISDEPYAVDGLTYTVPPDSGTEESQDVVYTYGTGRLHVTDTHGTAEAAAQLWGNVAEATWYPGTVQVSVLDPRITPFDVLSVTVDGQARAVPALGIAASYDGGYFGTVSAPGSTEGQEAAFQEGPITRAVGELTTTARAAAATATRAANAAAEAMDVAAATGQHFWYNATDTAAHGGTGAHVTDETQEEWDSAIVDGFPDLSPARPYHNLLMNSLGILLRMGLQNLASYTRSSVAFYDGQGNEDTNILARFGAGGTVIGQPNGPHALFDAATLELSSESLTIWDDLDHDDWQSLLPHTWRSAMSSRRTAGAASARLTTDALEFYSGSTLLARYASRCTWGDLIGVI